MAHWRRCGGSLDGDVVAQWGNVVAHWIEMWWLVGSTPSSGPSSDPASHTKLYTVNLG